MRVLLGQAIGAALVAMLATGCGKAGTLAGVPAPNTNAASTTQTSGRQQTTQPGPLAKVIIEPNQVVVGNGGSARLVANGQDAKGNPVAALRVQWSVDPGVGQIDQVGTFTATGQPGDYPGAITATSDGIQGHADVSIGNTNTNPH